MAIEISLRFNEDGSLSGIFLNQRLTAAHLHSMHPANRPGRPAALGPLHRDGADQSGDD